MRSSFTLLFALALGLVGCAGTDTEPSPANGVTVSYAQTSCADPWYAPGTNSDAGFQQALENYVRQQGIKLYQVHLTASGQQAMCLACSCTTGRRVEAVAEAKDVDALLKMGFKQQ
jgi:hypothetical protein